MATTKIINDLIDLNQTGNTTALKGCVGTNANQPQTPTISVQYLVVGGGGGAGGFGQAGGGGGGGFSTGTIAAPNITAINIVVGIGGTGGTGALPAKGINGQDSGFYTIQGQGGGAGSGDNDNGLPGGSGGGSGSDPPPYSVIGGTGISGQGNSGGSASVNTYAPPYCGAGGGGADSSGGDGNNSVGNGGTGRDAVPLGIITQANAVTAGVGETDGAETNFAGGGGGGAWGVLAGGGGLGGGANGNIGDGVNAIGSTGFPGTANTGGGGGGAGSYTSGNAGGVGGSGVVILRFASTTTYSVTGITVGNEFTEGSDTVLVFKSGSGTITLTGSSALGPKVGDLRTNTDQTSDGSASTMEHFMSTGWKIMSATGSSTLGICNYPTTAAALYQFENTPDATCGTNPSSTQNLAYVAGVPQFGATNKALYFKGGAENSGVGTEWLSSTAIVDSQQNLSISFWINFDAFGSGSGGAYQYLWTSYVTGDVQIAMSDVGSSTGYSKIRGNVYNGGSQYVLSQELVISTWYHVVFTRSTTAGMVLYINGTSVDTNSNTTQPAVYTAYNDSIGCYGYTPSGTRTEFKGSIDQFRAFQSVLTPTQITLLYNES